MGKVTSVIRSIGGGAIQEVQEFDSETAKQAWELHDYYEKQLASAAMEYLKTGKLADRLAAQKLKGKVEVLQQLLGTNRVV